MFDGLPEMCYALHPITKTLVVIRRGESGYFETNQKREFTQEEIDKLNIMELEVTKEQARAMFSGSMFGWDVPGANPKNYDKDGRYK